MNPDERKTALRVGIFLALGLGVVMFAVSMLGAKSGLFEGKSILIAHFADISGLVPGAPVRLAGLDVGTVKQITFEEDLHQREARVELSVKDRFMNRVRADSVAYIDSKGLLGDKLVNMTIGTPGARELRDGDTIGTRPSPSIEALGSKVTQAVDSLTRVSDKVGEVLDGLSDTQTRADMQSIVHSIAGILEGVQQGDGVAHRLIYDRRYADEFAGILEETQGTIGQLRRTIEHIQAMAAAARNGPGAVHELLYAESGARTVTSLQDAAVELAALMHAVRTEPGLLHTLIYDEKSGQILEQWSELSERVNRLTREMEKGRGTLGALLVDPSVYEDMKTILGNIERNVLLKALVRFTIKEDGIQRPAEMPRPAEPGERMVSPARSDERAAARSSETN